MYRRIAHSLFGFFCCLITKTVNHLTIENLEVIKRFNGPRIYVSNHPLTFDPLFFYNHLNRPIILMAQVVFNLPVIGWIVKHCGFIPVPNPNNKDGKKSAYNEAKWALLDNHSLFICPEGGGGQSVPRGSLGNASTGAARLAIETDTPIIPIGVSYNGKTIYQDILNHKEFIKMCYGGNYHVKFGQPIYLEKNTDPKEATKLIMNEIKKLMV